MKKPTEFEKVFTQGYVCALVAIIHSHGISTPVIDAFKCNRVPFDRLEEYGIDEHDIDTIRQHKNELYR